MGPELYFILVYNVPSRELEIHKFGGDYEAASQAYNRFDIEHRDDHAVEVVLVGADAIETIHKTHSHYFAEHADDLFQQFLEGQVQAAASHSGEGRLRPARAAGAGGALRRPGLHS
jgi:hypothetical protein